MDRIVITGDLQRPNPQWANINFVHELIRLQLSWVVDAEIVLECGEQPLSHLSWLREQDSEVIHPTIEKFSDKATLFITFEAQERFKRQCQKRNIGHIDIVLHPARFCRDLVFGVRQRICDLSKYIFSEHQMRFDAQLVSAGCAFIPGVACKPNSLLLVGQTEFDRSVVNGGRFLGFKDYEDEIKKIAKEYSQVIYKPHPYHKNHLNQIFTKEYGMIGDEPILAPDTNTYRLLWERNVSAVCSLSSSVIYEAYFWGKKTIHLMEKSWWADYVPVSAVGFISPNFWRHLLGQIMETKEPPQVTMPMDFVRKLIRSSWGFEF
jgi:hypothetical protein